MYACTEHGARNLALTDHLILKHAERPLAGWSSSTAETLWAQGQNDKIAQWQAGIRLASALRGALVALSVPGECVVRPARTRFR